MIPTIKDHKEQATNRILYQFIEKPNLLSLLSGWMKGVQTTEESLFDLLNERSIDTAIGTQLDNVGKIVGAIRGGRSDSSFREFIKLKILINTSEGTPNDLLEILSLITGGSIVKYFPHYPVGGNLYTNGSTIPSDLASTLTKSSPLTHGSIHVYQDLNNDALAPVELVRGLGILVDNNGDEIVDNLGNNIIVGGLGAILDGNPWRGVLSELDDSISQYGIPCEVYTK